MGSIPITDGGSAPLYAPDKAGKIVCVDYRSYAREEPEMGSGLTTLGWAGPRSARASKVGKGSSPG